MRSPLAVENAGGVSVQEYIEIAIIFVVLLMSIVLISAGIWFTWRLAKGDFVKVSIKNGGDRSQLVLEGAATAVLAVVCILAAVYLLTQAMAMYSGGGYDESDNAHFLSIVSTAVAAQEAARGGEGWAYLGPSNAVPEKQSFTTIVRVPGIEVMKTTQRVTLLDDHYERFTGTLVGTLLGYRKPKRTGHLDAGTCVSVDDRTVVGNGHTWLEVEVIEPSVCDELASEVGGLNLPTHDEH